MARVNTLYTKIVWLAWLALCYSASGAPDVKMPPARVLAKLSSDHCSDDSSSASTASAGTASPAAKVGLSVATLAAVRAKAAAVGLSFHSELPLKCWILLVPANSTEATEAAIEELKRPAAGNGEQAVTAESGSKPLFSHVAPDGIRRLSVTRPTTQRHRQKPQRSRSVRARKSSKPHVAKPSGTPTECNNNGCSELWGLKRIRAFDLWSDMGSKMPLPSITRKATIIDAGVDSKHNDISPQMDTVNSATFADASSNKPAGGVPYDNGHGTHVFGTAAGGWGGGDTRGIAGIAGPTNKQILSCNCFGQYGGAYDSDIVKCLDHARSKNAHYVVNLSLGGTGPATDDSLQFYKDAFGKLCAAGGIAVVAAGNGVCVGSGCGAGANGRDIEPYDYRGVDIANAGLQPDGTYSRDQQVDYPSYMARFYPDCVVAVANLENTANDKLASSSNYGQDVLLAAPGSDILSDWLTDGDPWSAVVASGTSMAAPHVTGSVILLRNSFPDATNTQVVKCMYDTSERTVTPYWSGSSIKGGVLNVREAYKCLQAIFSGGGGGGTTVDCKAQSVPTCVDASTGTATSCNSASNYCLTIGSTTCRYNYRDSNYPCSSASGSGKCSGFSTDCIATTPVVDCKLQSVPTCVDPNTGTATSCNSASNYCLTIGSTTCRYNYRDSNYPCSSGSGKCSGFSTDCVTTTPVVDCKSLLVPICVDPNSGKIVSSCNSLSNYCLTTGSTTCQYTFRGSDYVCDGSSGKCSGSSADCISNTPNGFCSEPPVVDSATYDWSCYDYTEVGSSCYASCDDGFTGEGYGADCLSDGVWSEVYGGGCEPDGSGTPGEGTFCWEDSTHFPCEVDGGYLCDEESGCMCVDNPSGGQKCQCNEDLGFTEWTYEPTGESYCVWSVDFMQKSNFRANKNIRAWFEFKVNDGQGDYICPEDYVVDSIKTDAQIACPTETFTPLKKSNAGVGKESCSSRTLLERYSFSTNPKQLPQSKNRCVSLIVTLTDGFYYNMTLKYNN